MNKALQKWAEKKVKILEKWAKEYDKLCKAEGIRQNNMICFAFDRDYVSSIHSTVKNEEENTECLIDTKASFFRNGKWC